MADAIPLSRPIESKDRMTVHFATVHEQLGEKPSQFVHKNSYMLETKGQPYARRYTLSSGWEALDLGWLKDSPVGRVVVRNKTVTSRMVLPTPEEIAEAQKKVVLVRFVGSQQAFSIPPNDFMYFQTDTPGALEVSATNGDADIEILINPK